MQRPGKFTHRKLILLLFVCALASFHAKGQIITTLEQIGDPLDVCTDAGGNVYFAASWCNLYKVTPSGSFVNIAGRSRDEGFSGDGGPATAAQFSRISGVAVDAGRNIYVADVLNQRVRKITPAGIVTTVAGTGTEGHSGDGGHATAAKLAGPLKVAVDRWGNLYITEYDSGYIRKVTPAGIISTIVGNGTTTYAGDGTAATACGLNGPEGIAVDYGGNLYIADWGNFCVRKVDPSGIITTIAGGGSGGDSIMATDASLWGPTGVTLDRFGNIYIAEYVNNRIRKIDTSGMITTFAGSGAGGSYGLHYSGDGGPATDAAMWAPSSVAVDSSGKVFIADYFNSRIRMVASVGPVEGPDTACISTTITLADTVSGGTWTSSNPAVATVSAEGVVTGITRGSVVISYTIDGQTMAKTLYVNSLPNAANISGSFWICPGATSTYTDATPGGVWGITNGSIATISTTGVVTTLASSGNDTVIYSITNTCGTTARRKAIRVIGTTIPSAICGSGGSICVGSSLTLAEYTAGGTWSSTNAGVASVSSSGVVTGISAGTDTIKYTVTNSCGVTGSSYRVVRIISVPDAGTITGSTTLVVHHFDTLTASVSGGRWGSMYTTYGTINGVGVLCGIAAGIDTVTYSVTNACGTGIAKKAVTIAAHREDNTGNTLPEEEAGGIKVYPNPSNGLVTIQLDGSVTAVSIIVTDINGKVLISNTTEGSSTQLSLGDYPAGIYLLSVNAGGKIYKEKLVVE